MIAATLSATWASATPAASSARIDPLITSLSQYRVDGWQTEQGLPLNTVQSMYQTRAGHLWVGTSGGVARFDGIRFTTFESSQAQDVASRPIFGFMEDREGNLWIGHSRGATRYRYGRFEPAFPSELMEGRRVWAFAEAADGVIWAASENGLVRWEKGKGVTKVFKEADGLPTIRLRTLTFDRDGTLWIGTTGGGMVTMKAGQFATLHPENGFPHREVRHVIADPAGGVWAATAGAGLIRVVDGQVSSLTTRDGLPTDQLTYLARAKSGALWIGTWGSGVARLHEGRVSTLSNATAGGIAGDQIWALHIDREDSVWVGTWNGGMNRLSARAFGALGKPEGLSHDNVRSVIHARDGATWVATAGGGVNRIDASGIKIFNARNGLPTDESSTLMEDRDGAIWFGSYTEGVVRYRQGRLEKFGVAQGLPNVDVRMMYQDRAGTIWAGTKSGLARFDGRGFVALRDAGAPLEGITTLLEDRAGSLWVGTTGQGLFRYREGKFTTLARKDGLVSNWILALYEDKNGALWIGTNGEGINRLKNDRLTAIRPTDGLWDGIAQVIIEDKAGYLWMTCNRGFFRVARAELDAFADGQLPRVTSAGYGPGDALRSTTFAGGVQPAGTLDARGKLWLPSLKGLVLVDPANLPDSNQPPTVMIDDVAVNGVSSPHEDGIELPPGSVPLTIRYAAGTLLNADRVRFRYQMEGITQNWVESGKNREASFPTLPHGKYRFRVSATTDGKTWQEAPSTLPIVVKPHFYQTAWFIALAMLTLIATAAGLYRLRTHQLRQHHADMERLVAEKTEELLRANEHLSRLSFADSLTGLANRRRLDETLEGEWRRGLRMATPLAVVIADIDFFKAYNDTLGHLEGDKCLVSVAQVFRDAASRAGDFAARYGGEEFIVLIPGANHAAATDFAERLRRACEARAIPHPASPAGPLVTISLGVASAVPTESASATELVAQADAALYRAKLEGRNRVR